MQADNEKNFDKWIKRGEEAEAFYQEGLRLERENEPLRAIKLFYKAFRHTGHYEASYKVEAFCSRKDNSLAPLTRFHLDYIDSDKERDLNLEGTWEDIFYRGLLEYTGGIYKRQPDYNVATRYFEHIIKAGQGSEWVKEAHFMMGVYWERMDDIGVALHHYEIAVKMGHSNALVRSGHWYEQPAYRDLSEAESEYRKAAEQYDVNACARLAYILGRKKHFTDEDKISAFEERMRYLKQAVTGGDSSSVIILCNNLNRKKNESELMKWMRIAERVNSNMTSTLASTVPAQESFSLPRIPSNSPGRNRDFLFYQGQPYQRHEVDPDGDCGYTAFGITREDAFELILENRQDERVHQILIDLIVETLSMDENFANYLPAKENLKNVKEAHRLYKACLTYTGRDRRALEEANAANLKKAVNESMSELLAHYLKYDIVEKRVDFGWTHPLILFALAHIQKIPLRLWKLNERGEMIPHPQFLEYNPQNPEQEPTNLLFVHGNHFERLEMQNRVDERPVPPPILQENQSVNYSYMLPALRRKPETLVARLRQPTKTPLDKIGNNRHILLSLVEEDTSKNAKRKQKVRKVVKKTERPEEKEIDNNRQRQRRL